MMRVGLVTPRYAPFVGGVEAHVAGIATGLAGRAEVTVVTQARRAGERRDGSVRVIECREAFPSDTYPVAPGVVGWLRRHAGEFDVVHAHSYHGAPALPAAAAARGAFVFTPHYHGTGHSAFARVLHRPYARLGRRIFERADRVICVSGAEAELVASHHPHVAALIDVVPNGVDVAAITTAQPFERPRPVVLVLGRLLTYKRVDTVVRAMAGVHEDAELVIVGDGPERASLSQLAAGIGRPVRLTGRVDADEVHRWLRSASVVVSMSRHEAFGLTLLEALTAGCRVVASDIAAHREIAARWGRDGSVVLVDGLADLASAIDVQLWAGSLAPDARAAWSWDDVATETLGVYQRAVENVLC